MEHAIGKDISCFHVGVVVNFAESAGSMEQKVIYM